MSKYIDLTDTISRDNGTLTVYAWRVLKWLDEHPDQVPGRTITESEFAIRMGGITSYTEPGSLARESVEQFGITVIPDPKPTNAEKLMQLLNAHDPHRNEPTADLAGALDAAGVKAPGGDDE